MTRYIDADKLYQKMLDLQGTKRERYLDIDEVRKIIKKQPTEEVTPIIRGKWECLKNKIYRCSVCQYISDNPTRYCSWCGAKMEWDFKKGEKKNERPV